jgi:uncharacterized peroxidase-related enzyme
LSKFLSHIDIIEAADASYSSDAPRTTAKRHDALRQFVALMILLSMERHMARIQALSVSEAPASTQPQLQAIEKATGFLPNLFGTLANSQAAFGAFLQMQQPLGRGELRPAEKETIALAVSQVSGCEYCLAAHTVLGGNVGLTDEAIRAARNGTGSAVAELARSIAQQRGRVSDEDVAKAREAGLSDSKMVEIVANVALVIFTNYVNNFADTEVDFPPVEV